jgi:hypothetical protein
VPVTAPGPRFPPRVAAPSTTRSSSWAVRPIISIDSSAPLASSGRRDISRLPTAACTVTTARAWATTSCSSRAMRTRSSRTCWRARSASAARSRSACSASPARYRRRAAVASPTDHAAASGRKPSTALTATGGSFAADAAYNSPPPSAPAASATARTDSRLGSRDAIRYAASPSSTIIGGGTVPEAITNAARPAHTAKTATAGHRRPLKAPGTSRPLQASWGTTIRTLPTLPSAPSQRVSPQDDGSTRSAPPVPACHGVSRR